MQASACGMNNNDQFTAAPACFGYRLRGWMAGRWLNAARAVAPLGVADGDISVSAAPDNHAALDLLRELESRVQERNFTYREVERHAPVSGALIDRCNAVIEAIERTVS